jgi:hypothetical protein
MDLFSDDSIKKYSKSLKTYQKKSLDSLRHHRDQEDFFSMRFVSFISDY